MRAESIDAYSQFVSDRRKPGEDILHHLTPEDCHRLHMILGLAGELLELYTAKTQEARCEELGDLEYYLQGLMTSYDVSRITKLPLTWEWDCQSRFEATLEQVLTYVKREIIYQKPAQTVVIKHALREIDRELAEVELRYGFTRSQVWNANMQKLRARYPQGYTDAAANRRDDKTTA